MHREKLGGQKLLAVAVMASLLVTTSALSATNEVGAQAGVADDSFVIQKTVIGEPSPTDFTFTVSPEVVGCGADQTITIPGSGGAAEVLVQEFSTSIEYVELDNHTLSTSPVFNDLLIFFVVVGFENPQELQPGVTLVDPPLDTVTYRVRGVLSEPTPSGFPAFDLEREMTGAEFYAQGGSFQISIAADAVLNDGLSAAELDDSAGPGFQLDAREVDTGRYHPPIIELRSDGSGSIRNSNNSGGVNPATGQVVDVDFGDEYIVNFEPVAQPGFIYLTTPGFELCSYSVSENPTPGQAPLFATAVTGISGINPPTFYSMSSPLLCNGVPATIDLTTQAVPRGTGLTITGTAGDDVIVGSSGSDSINGLDGSDRICGKAGDDLISGGNDKDYLDGGEGGDEIRGGFGIDRIFGRAGGDRLFGDGGSDRIFAGPGIDTVFAGSGADRVFGGSGDDDIHGMGGQDFLHGEEGNDTIQGNWQSDNIWGGPGNDVLRGAGGKDKVYGQGGNDRLYGGVNSDYLEGGPGDDLADGQQGRERPFLPEVQGCIAETIIRC